MLSYNFFLSLIVNEYGKYANGFGVKPLKPRNS